MHPRHKDENETVGLHSDKRDEWIREVREERLHGTVDSWSSAPRVA